ncbi:MAG: hypothetical protein HHJ15_17165 [Rhodoferax sp.]|uniref:hypothetical protein n=1 Tax=Rhodoferax sp. TaxID=50421 RepID=UPI0017E04588|nr:hypothetical protein [Rhodoferax sp.]NMM21652.1 hypothetical protein [Rhodoferax sp.]
MNIPQAKTDLVQQALPKPNAKTERQRDYCKKLCSVVARYLKDDELTGLVQALETFKGNVLAEHSQQS